MLEDQCDEELSRCRHALLEAVAVFSVVLDLVLERLWDGYMLHFLDIVD